LFDVLMTHRAFKDVYESVMSGLLSSSARAMVQIANTTAWSAQINSENVAAAPYAEKKEPYLLIDMDPFSVSRAECVPLDRQGSRQARRTFNEALMKSGLILRSEVTVCGYIERAGGITISLISNKDYMRALVPNYSNQRCGSVTDVIFLRGPNCNAIAAGLILRKMYGRAAPVGIRKFIREN
jgi:hypothetical protein